MKFNVSRKLGKEKVQRLYLMEIWVEGYDKPAYKFGKASGHSSKERMLQIIGSYFDCYRCTPIIKIVRDREVDDVFTKETSLHHEFIDDRISCDGKKWSGMTECFLLDKDIAIEAYERVVDAANSE